MKGNSVKWPVGGVLLAIALCLPAATRAADAPEAATQLTPAEMQRLRQEEAARALAEKRSAAKAEVDKAAELLLRGQWAELDEQLKVCAQQRLNMAPEVRDDWSYIQTLAKDCRPDWWSNTTSSSNASFKARIWNRDFIANYMPSEAMGLQAAVGIMDGRLQVIVSWRPSMINDPAPAEGELSQRFSLTKSHIGQVIVWHELGHNYISNFLPLEQVLELYASHAVLYTHLQELYADLTALYHCEPRSRLATLMIRLPELDRYNERDAHARACHAIGSILLSEALADPKAWPSFHWPAAVPERDVERNTIIYLYEHLSPDWTLAEDKALRTLVDAWIRRNGERALRARGTVYLNNRLEFKLMAAEDRDWQARRDEWVKQRLSKIIADGLADTAEPASRPAQTVTIRERDGATRTVTAPAGPPRIVLPW